MMPTLFSSQVLKLESESSWTQGLKENHFYDDQRCHYPNTHILDFTACQCHLHCTPKSTALPKSAVPASFDEGAYAKTDSASECHSRNSDKVSLGLEQVS